MKPQPPKSQIIKEGCDPVPDGTEPPKYISERILNFIKSIYK